MNVPLITYRNITVYYYRNITVILYRVHSGLVTIHGCGIAASYQPSVRKMGCLSVFR